MPKHDAEEVLSNGTFLFGAGLEAAIKKVLGGADLRCAVAFWGHGAEARIPKRALKHARLICNLETGGTNPRAIRKLLELRADIRTHAFLHAKVYLSDRGGVVTSANLSANGLGLEGGELARWREAGVFLQPGQPLRKAEAWFEDIAAQSSEITPEALAVAEEQWRRRQKAKPALPTFASVDPVACGYLLSWAGWESWTPLKESIEAQLGRKYDDAIEQRLEDGTEIEGPEDRTLLPGRWVLWWDPILGGAAEKRGLPEAGTLRWGRISDIVIEDAYRRDIDGRIYSTLLADERAQPEPFDVGDQAFVDAFVACMREEKYRPLRTIHGYEGSWFAPKMELIQDFWMDLRSKYNQLVVVSPA